MGWNFFYLGSKWIWTTYRCNSGGLEQLCPGHHSQVRQVSEQVTHSHQRNTDHDGQGKIPVISNKNTHQLYFVYRLSHTCIKARLPLFHVILCFESFLLKGRLNWARSIEFIWVLLNWKISHVNLLHRLENFNRHNSNKMLMIKPVYSCCKSLFSFSDYSELCVKQRLSKSWPTNN